METKKLIGIISSILIIINYAGNVIIDLFVQNNIQFIEFHETFGRLIFTMSMIGFYFSLSKYLKLYGFQTEVKILVSLILIEFVSLIIIGIQYYYAVIPGFISSIIYISAMIIFIIFGIRILRLKDKKIMNLKILKLFVIVMFIVFGLVLIAIALLTFNHRMELINVAFSLYGLPYILGLLFFLNDKKVEKQPAVNSKYIT